MISKLLLPNRFKMIGWCILIPAAILGIALTIKPLYTIPLPEIHAKVFAIIADQILGPTTYFGFTDVELTNTIAGVLFIIGALLVSFSKQKREDEFIANLRLSSLLWAVLANYILLLLTFVFVYGDSFLTVMEYSMFTVLIIFIIRFNYILYRSSKTASDEK